MPRSLHPAALAAMILAVTAPAAFAVDPKPIRECPPEHRLTTPRELTAPPDVGTTREVLSYAELTGWQGIQGLALRIRRITVEPGGYVPLHYHHERPSVDYIIQGELTEYNSFCAVPIVHRKGDSAERFGDFIGHWWKNESTETVILVSADVVPIGLVNF